MSYYRIGASPKPYDVAIPLVGFAVVLGAVIYVLPDLRTKKRAK